MSDQSILAMKKSVADACRARFGEPNWIAVAPGRVNLIGEHVDYNDGFVLPIAIDRYTIIAATRAAEPPRKRVDLFSMELKSCQAISLDRPVSPTHGLWTNYVAGVIDGFQELGYEIPPFSAVVHSTVPAGSGLSSSAALEVATATLLESMLGIKLDPLKKALLCQKAEHEFAGVPCGAMDQLASVFGLAGHAMLIDCQSHSVKQVPMTIGDASILVVNSRVKHELADGQYALRRQQCRQALKLLGKQCFRQVTQKDLETNVFEPDSVLYRRARHVVTESARTVAAADSLENGDLASVGDLMAASHQSMRDDYEISCPEIDELVRIAQQIGPNGGVFGARMTGGGFGGCTVNLVANKRVDEVSNSIREQYQAAFGIVPEMFVVRPSNGAHILDLI